MLGLVEMGSISSLFLPAPPSVGTACLPCLPVGGEAGGPQAGRFGVKALPFERSLLHEREEL